MEKVKNWIGVLLIVATIFVFVWSYSKAIHPIGSQPEIRTQFEGPRSDRQHPSPF
jgi:hypothetical protein